MGVPAFFRWLARKYPSIIVSVVEDKNAKEEDLNGPNPNQIEFDNVYLDMNGIIHPCCHPEYKAAPETEEDMMIDIFAYIDRLVGILRPRKLLYMAVDGVAPRAKMNQQRSRRFRASQESDERSSSIAKVKAEIAARGITLPDEAQNKPHFDSNCITPGTPFMHKLSICLRYYIQDRLSNHPAWKNMKVILSDANVPGEGEHKIMDYIRRQRANPDHDPNTRHCLCGADADLIMLGLATHEPHFTIIREEFKPNQSKPCDLCKQKGHELKDCTGAALIVNASQGNDLTPFASSLEDSDDALEGLPLDGETSFLFIRLDVLRQYLERELIYDFTARDFGTGSNQYNNNYYNSGSPNRARAVKLRKDLDLERIIDDWVFLCFFVGNDFLPHLPSLEIRENAIDRLIKIYKEVLNELDGYLTCNGSVNLKSTQIILNKLGEVEDTIFKQRQENELRFKRRQAERNQREDLEKSNAPGNSTFYPLGRQGFNPTNSNQAIKFVPQGATASDLKNARKIEKDYSDSDNDDNVRLYEDGWKDRYYSAKFRIDDNDLKFRNEVAMAYAKGLCWVLLYYYQGCPCWNWFFPYHYAPFASDFQNMDKQITNKFEIKTHPFKPLEQLMAVFPASSGKHIPTPWAELMTVPDSPILDFYPTNFKVDLNGKRYAWQGVALLPFVEENRLLKTLRDRVYDKLTPFEQILNARGFDRLYISGEHSAFGIIKSILASDLDTDQASQKDFITLNAKLFQGLGGSIKPDPDFLRLEKENPGILVSPLPQLKNTDLKAVGIYFKDPTYPDNFVFQAKLLPNLEMPVECLKPLDWDESKGRYRPPLGFGNNVTTLERPRPELDSGGRRMMNHAISSAMNHNAGANPRGLSYRGDVSETRRQQASYNQNNNFNYNNHNNNNYSNRPRNHQSSMDSYVDRNAHSFESPKGPRPLMGGPESHRTNDQYPPPRGNYHGAQRGNLNYYYSPRPPGALGNSPNPRMRILQRSAMAHNAPPPPIFNDHQDSANFNWQQQQMMGRGYNDQGSVNNSYLQRINPSATSEFQNSANDDFSYSAPSRPPFFNPNANRGRGRGYSNTGPRY